jgi:hypothetical protein
VLLSVDHQRNPIQIENMHLLSVLAFIFDIDGTLVDSNELHLERRTNGSFCQMR